METVSYSFTVLVKGGPSIPIAGTIEVDGYEKFTVTVPAAAGGNDGSAAVAVAPGNLADVKLLIVTSTRYDGTVSFETSAGGTAVPLDGPLTLVGAAAVGLLASPLDTLTLTNSAATAASVTILVGRDAVS